MSSIHFYRSSYSLLLLFSVGCGTLVPLLPILIPMLLKLPLSRPISLAFGASALACVGFAFVWGYEHHHQASPDTDKLVSDVEALIRGNELDSAIALIQQSRKKD